MRDVLVKMINVEKRDNLKKRLLKTGDGSTTLHLPKWNEQYHSKHGAIQEALYVYIKHGLEYALTSGNIKHLSILEIGFGTGLNTLLTYLHTQEIEDLMVEYTGLEAYPVTINEVEKLNFATQLEVDNSVYQKFHTTDWEQRQNVSDRFYLTKKNIRFEDFEDADSFDLIYFDAFGPRVQPELWEKPIFEQMHKALKTNGVLVTYSAKGAVRRAMQEVGFLVERLPGPPGKREMLRAVKELTSSSKCFSNKIKV